MWAAETTTATRTNEKNIVLVYILKTRAGAFENSPINKLTPPFSYFNQKKPGAYMQTSIL